MFRSLTINMERGVGLVSGHGSDPSIYLDWSDDGGHTWCSKRSASMGKIGAFKPSITFNRLGCRLFGWFFTFYYFFFCFNYGFGCFFLDIIFSLFK